MVSLTLNHIVKQFGNKTILDDVCLNVNQQEIVGLLGTNGAGKTTCFHTIVGQVKPNRGTIEMNEKNLASLAIHQRALLGLAYLPQEKSIFTDLTASENIQAVFEIQATVPTNQHQQKAHQLLDEMGIAHLADSPAQSLSGGERRRVEIARLLAINPTFIIMDEPFAAISPIAIKDLQKVIFNLRHRGIGILITDHNVRDTLKICDRAYIIDNGCIIAEGSPKDIVANEKALHVYLGKDFDGWER